MALENGPQTQMLTETPRQTAQMRNVGRCAQGGLGRASPSEGEACPAPTLLLLLTILMGNLLATVIGCILCAPERSIGSHNPWCR